MAEAAREQIPQIGVGIVNLKGKVEAFRRHQGHFYTRLIMPASDQFSSPITVEIRSKSSLGSNDEMVSIRAKVGGYRKRPFRFTDKETGETRQVTPVVVTLDAIDE